MPMESPSSLSAESLGKGKKGRKGKAGSLGYEQGVSCVLEAVGGFQAQRPGAPPGFQMIPFLFYNIL